MRYFIATIVIIFLLLIGAIAFIARPKSSNNANEPAKPTVVTITDYANTSSDVQMTLDGKIVGDEQHRAIRVSISSERRKVEIIEGYDGKVIDSHIFPNDAAAYDVFLHALKTANFMKQRTNVAADLDEKGVCPTGRRYIYELFSNGTSVKRLWSTSCSSNQGTNAGTNDLMQQLFKQQIPDYNKLTSKVVLG